MGAGKQKLTAALMVSAPPKGLGRPDKKNLKLERIIFETLSQNTDSNPPLLIFYRKEISTNRKLLEYWLTDKILITRTK